VEILIALAAGLLLAVVFVVISAPLRAARSAANAGEPADDEQARRPAAAKDDYEHDELEAARETKYREIRDAELDLRTGKLSREDYEAIDSGLRAEALELLDRLEAIDGTRSDGAVGSSGSVEPDEAKPKLES
jgi:flagellar biosynthesis/type III secretory pathway M-ring protein FliF/YscJ